MKSDRRHELQTNSLDQALRRTPDFLREHGSKVLLGIIIILLIAIMVHQRTRRNQEELDSNWGNITTARISIERLGMLPAQSRSPSGVVETRRQLIDASSTALTSVISSDNPQLAAEAYLLRGDLNWTLANMPELPEAATQPSLKLPDPAQDYLNRAKEAYEKVIRVYPDQTLSVMNARFGLAAIAEDQHDWAAAKSIYQEIKNDAKTIASYKTLAELRLGELDRIQSPVYIAPTSRPTTAPAARAVEATRTPAAPVTAPAK
jgi:tetratricopeptide (TPR) repeat protein